MAPISLKVSRDTFFHDYLEFFSKLVHEENRFCKMPYDSWKKLSYWAADTRYNGFQIYDKNYTSIAGVRHTVWCIQPTSLIDTVPNAEEFEKDDNSFGSFLSHHAAIIDAQCTSDLIQNQINTSSIAWGTASTTDVGINHITAGDVLSVKGCDATSTLYIDDKSIQTIVEETIRNYNKKEEEKNNMKFGNFDFGPVDDNVRMSMYGLAIRNASGTYVSYNPKDNQIVDVDIFNFEGASKVMYKLPAAIKDISVGDVVIHARKPMFVSKVNENGKLTVIDIFDGEEKSIMLARSPFGFDFITKVVSFIDFTSANTENPFGNMLPLLMLSNNKDNMLPFLLMAQNSGTEMNPMMMYVLMNDNQDMLPLLMYMSVNKPSK